MEPKTKLQKEIWDLYATLPEITEEQKQWAYKHCLTPQGYLSKNIITCMECGHDWEDKASLLTAMEGGCTCPGCGSKLEVTKSRKQKDKQEAYCCMLTTCKGFQVIRFFNVRGHYKKGKKVDHSIHEIVQQWISPEGKYEFIARLKGAYSYYSDSWSWRSPMKIRNKANATSYDLFPNALFPKRKYIPQIKRNGFRGTFHGLRPLTMFSLLLSDSMVETLLKTRQFSLLKRFIDYPEKIRRYWPSIKICIRNNYKISDASLWFDYIESLAYFGKDLRSPKFVCPVNLRKEHDYWDEKRKARKRQESREKQIREAVEAEARYQKAKGIFSDLEITDGEILIRPLRSVQEFHEEGSAMRHCVGGYHDKGNSLVLSATIDGKRIETIEFSLMSFQVVQSRGKCNNITPYHDRILELMKKNTHLIRKRQTA